MGFARLAGVAFAVIAITVNGAAAQESADVVGYWNLIGWKVQPDE